jgi:hypothetical protein
MLDQASSRREGNSSWRKQRRDGTCANQLGSDKSPLTDEL